MSGNVLSATQSAWPASPVQELPPEPCGLYLHIPFCEKKCDYCDFYSITRLDQMDIFVDALLGEIEMRAAEFAGCVFQTVFWGGGTPSLLSEAQLRRINEALQHHFQIAPEAERSIESNPGTLSAEKLALFRELGFNRLSMGVQSFNPAELRFLGRIHSVEEVLENFRQARAVGFDNINIDLMTAFPGITPASFRHSLARALALGAEHLSCYTLIFEPGTVFHKRMLHGELQPLPDDEETRYYEIAAQLLEKHGYRQYEVSNFARGESRICRHNLIYWRHHPYLGLGPSAHSFHQNCRQANKRSLTAYVNALQKGQPAIDFQETLAPADLRFEYIFLNLRLQSGVNREHFRRRFGGDVADFYPAALSRLLEEELVELSEGYLRLSKKGWMVADSVAAYF